MFSYFYIINTCVIIVFICLFFITRKTNKRWSKINDYLGKVTTTVDSIRYGNLSTKIEKIEHPTYQNVTDSINRMVETLNDREKMIIEYQAELMRQNKLLESVINSLSDGILIINEKFEILRATPKILKWFGIKGKDIIGKNVFEFIQLSDDETIRFFRRPHKRRNDARHFQTAVQADACTGRERTRQGGAHEAHLL